MAPPDDDPSWWAGPTVIIVETGSGWVEVGPERLHVEAPAFVEIKHGAKWRFGHDETDPECVWRLYILTG